MGAVELIGVAGSLSLLAGWRLYLVTFATGVAMRTGWLDLPDRLDARFRKLWRYYLMYCEGGFRGGGIDVAQVTLLKR